MNPLSKAMLVAVLFLACWFAPPIHAAPQKLVIKGSNTFGEELGPRLIEQFNKRFPDVTVELESKGTASGFAALMAGECDIGSTSRLANEDELRLARSRRIRLSQYTIGYYGVAVVVNETNTVTDLSDMQVRSVFTGMIVRWNALGWEERPIQSYIRDPVSGTYLGFQELAMDRMPYARTAKMFRSYQQIADAVKADPGGIGYVGMNLARQDGLRALRINGTKLTREAVNDGIYPYARQLRLYTNTRRESIAAKRFIRFAQSQLGQRVLNDLGFVRRFEMRVSPFSEP